MLKIGFALSVINLALMIFVLSELKPASAQQQYSSQVLRGRSLEIVDSLGKVRASIKIEPPVTMNGKQYPQTVILRLIDTKGGPLVKLGASEGSSGLNLDDGADAGVQLIADNSGSFIKVKNQDGKEQVVKP